MNSCAEMRLRLMSQNRQIRCRVSASKFSISQSGQVPELDGAVAGSRRDAIAIWRKCQTKHFTSVLVASNLGPCHNIPQRDEPTTIPVAVTRRQESVIWRKGDGPDVSWMSGEPMLIGPSVAPPNSDGSIAHTGGNARSIRG